MYKLVVFDLDGTLCNTLSDLASAVNNALESVGLPTHATDRYNKFVGNGVNNLIRQAMGEHADNSEMFTRVKKYFDEYYPQHLCDSTVLYDGIDELLDKLSELGVMTAVHSNKPHAYVLTILDRILKEHKFLCVFGQQECYERKPSAQALLQMLDMLGVCADDTLYVGDSDVDVLTAHNGGLKVCGVAWGFRGERELMSAGADYIAQDVQQLYSIIVGQYEQEFSKRTRQLDTEE